MARNTDCLLVEADFAYRELTGKSCFVYFFVGRKSIFED